MAFHLDSPTGGSKSPESDGDGVSESDTDTDTTESESDIEQAGGKNSSAESGRYKVRVASTKTYSETDQVARDSTIVGMTPSDCILSDNISPKQATARIERPRHSPRNPKNSPRTHSNSPRTAEVPIFGGSRSSSLESIGGTRCSPVQTGSSDYDVVYTPTAHPTEEPKHSPRFRLEDGDTPGFHIDTI